jgi:hypothetical protein
MTSPTSLHASESGQRLIRVRAADTADHGFVIVRSLGVGPPPGCGAPVPRGSGGSLASDIPAGGHRALGPGIDRPDHRPGNGRRALKGNRLLAVRLTRAWRCSHPGSRKRGGWVERKDRSRFDLAALAQLNHRRKWCKLDSSMSILSLKFLISHKITKACCLRRGSRHRYQARQPQFPGDRDHRLSQEWRTLEKAAAMANHASTRTTQLYERRRDEVSLDEVERIVI